MIDVRGMTWDEAKAALNKSGLGITSGGSEESEEYEDGQIMKQSVEPDTVVEKNTTIQVITAVKKLVKVEIPNVLDETKEDAAYRLEQAGFKVDFSELYDDETKAGRVVKTTPEVGTEVAEGSTIVITISKGPQTVYTTVPKLTGKTREEAEQAIKNANLVVGDIDEAYSDTVEKGMVISQVQTAGSEVEEKVTINFVVSKGPEMVEIPNLFGNPKDRVKEKLTSLGLGVEFIEKYSDETVGRAFKTEPGEGTKVKQGSTIKVYISVGPYPPSPWRKRSRNRYTTLARWNSSASTCSYND